MKDRKSGEIKPVTKNVDQPRKESRKVKEEGKLQHPFTIARMTDHNVSGVD